MNTLAPLGALPVPVFGYGRTGCEGPQCITLDLDFTANDVCDVDISALQSQGKYSAFGTFYVDNSVNTKALSWVCDGSYQTGIIPPLSCAYLNLLQPNPPKISFTSTGSGILVRSCFLNYFLPPVVWSPTSPPGGGGTTGSAIIQGGLTNLSGVIAAGGVAQVLQAATPTRQYLIVTNPISASEILQIRFAGGGWIDLAPGGSYETDTFVPNNAVQIVAATTNHAFTAYAG